MYAAFTRSYVLTLENIDKGIETSLTIPAMAAGCTIDLNPTITPNTDVAFYENHFVFTPTVNTDYTIVYSGSCQDYVFTVSVEVEGGCSYANTGTIFFDDCVGKTYFFIEMEDGTLLDPY